jgi:hypothetical protein
MSDRRNVRDARSGQFVKKDQATKRPNTTVTETLPSKKPKKG